MHSCPTQVVGISSRAREVTVPSLPAHSASHHLTILKPRNFAHARKTITASGEVRVEGIPAHFAPSELCFEDIEDVAEFIEQGLYCNHALVTGKVIRLTSGSTPERLTVHRVSANFGDVGQRLIAIDIDGAPCPDHLEWHEEPDQVASHLVRTILPIAFHDVSFCWFWSASHGSRGKVFTAGLNASEIRIRILFLADRNVTSAEMLIWLNDIDGIDLSMFQPERLIFVCRPYLHYAGNDPLHGLKLTGLVRGALDEVPVPSQEALQQSGKELKSVAGSNCRRSSGSSFSSFLNGLALDHLPVWVPSAGLVGLDIRNGQYWCIAHWRASSSGRPMTERHGQVSIHPHGIRDFGADGGRGTGITPIRLVMLARGCDAEEARRFLCKALKAEIDRILPPWNPICQGPSNV